MLTLSIPDDLFLALVKLAQKKGYKGPHDLEQVIRGLLILERDRYGGLSDSHGQISSGNLATQGGEIPNGTLLRARYKSKPVEVKVDREIVFPDGYRAKSPSAAAKYFQQRCGNLNPSTNGWKFWEYLAPDGNWRPLADIRKLSVANANDRKFTRPIMKLITRNDIRARILRIPNEIKATIRPHQKVVICNSSNNPKQLNVDRQGQYIGGVTEFFRKSGLIGHDGTFYPKRASWSKYRDGWKVEIQRG